MEGLTRRARDKCQRPTAVGEPGHELDCMPHRPRSITLWTPSRHCGPLPGKALLRGGQYVEGLT